MTRPSATQVHEQALRREKVAALRLAGVRNQRVILDALVKEGVAASQATISRDFAALDAVYRERAAADIAREKGIDLDRVEEMIRGLWPEARKGRWLAVDRVVNLLARKAKMLGYDAPEQVEHTGNQPIIRVTILDGSSDDTDRPAAGSLASAWGGGHPLPAD